MVLGRLKHSRLVHDLSGGDLKQDPVEIFDKMAGLQIRVHRFESGTRLQ